MQKVHADAVVGIAQAKAGSLLALSMRDCALGDEVMAYMLGALPGVAFDGRCQSPVNGSPAAIQLPGESSVRAYNYSKLTVPTVLFVRTFPQHLVSLDLSDSVFRNAQNLGGALGSLSGPIALAHLNLARSSYTGQLGKLTN
jgi:hypothetical protein